MAATGILSCTLSTGLFGATASSKNALRKATQAPRFLRHKQHAVLSINAKSGQSDEDEDKESLFTSITNALDFAAVRSEEDRELLREAKKAAKGTKMTPEQYGALRRKVGGTAKSYFKEFIDVDGVYVDSGWVDKTCKFCKKDTSKEPRQKDGGGRYAHISCAEEAKAKGNIFTRLFRR